MGKLLKKSRFILEEPGFSELMFKDANVIFKVESLTVYFKRQCAVI